MRPFERPLQALVRWLLYPFRCRHRWTYMQPTHYGLQYWCRYCDAEMLVQGDEEHPPR